MSGSPLLALVGLCVAAGGAASAVDGWRARDDAWLSRTLDAPGAVARLRADRDALAVLAAQKVALEAEPEPTPQGRVIVVSLADRKLELRDGPRVVHSARAAVGMGAVEIEGDKWFFDTPIGTLKVIAKEEAPIWVAPDWHYKEMAFKGKGEVITLSANRPYRLPDGRTVELVGNDVGIRDTAGVFTPSPPSKDVWEGSKIFMPPTSANQRRFSEILGDYRLKLTDGFGVHGTNKPESVGRAASHGCIRLTNADITKIYDQVQVGTRVMIY